MEKILYYANPLHPWPLLKPILVISKVKKWFGVESFFCRVGGDRFYGGSITLFKLEMSFVLSTAVPYQLELKKSSREYLIAITENSVRGIEGFKVVTDQYGWPKVVRGEGPGNLS